MEQISIKVVDNLICIYANYSTKLVKRNFKLHDPYFPLLVGNVNAGVVKEVRESSYIDRQQKLILLALFWSVFLGFSFKR
ncbi:hypothetical protein TL18_06620 [Methanobrevibacter sp. YE315]|nr:hypothetical protein TL18_06620 [Methanobrevibacter sp. YE315]